MPDQPSEHGAVRQRRKQRTRQALLDAALGFLEDESFSSISLRQVTREAGVAPTAFYRHFEDMDELGLALIDESFRTLRMMIRAVRADPQTAYEDVLRSSVDYDDVIRTSVEILVDYVHEHNRHFRFIARERFGGVAVLRHAIRSEIRLFVSDLATDLARFPGLDRWTTEDLQLLAGLMVNTMVATAEAILDAPAEDPAAEVEIITTARRQMRMITLGIPRWRTPVAQPLPPASADGTERQAATARGDP